MADKPPLPPAPGMATKPKQPKPSAVAAQAPTTRPMPGPALKKPPPLAPPRQGVPPLKPPPAHHFRQHQQAGATPRKHHRNNRGSSCSCRRVCCVATGLVLLVLCLAFAAACLAYLYYHPHPPSFHLQPLSLTRFKITNSTAVSAMDVTVRAKLVSWNPNDRVAFEYAGNGEGRVALADADGDIPLGWGPVVLGGQGGGGFEHAPRSVAALGFVAAAKGVVVDEAVAGRVRDRYRRRQLAFKVVVDTHVGVRLAGLALRTGMVPVRVFCDGGVMAPRGSSAAGSPMSKCQVYLFRMKWLSLN